MNLVNFKDALQNAISVISTLKEEAEALRDELETVIDACETIEDTL